MYLWGVSSLYRFLSSSLRSSIVSSLAFPFAPSYQIFEIDNPATTEAMEAMYNLGFLEILLASNRVTCGQSNKEGAFDVVYSGRDGQPSTFLTLSREKLRYVRI